MASLRVRSLIANAEYDFPDLDRFFRAAFKSNDAAFDAAVFHGDKSVRNFGLLYQRPRTRIARAGTAPRQA
jgi:hypothetical protein